MLGVEMKCWHVVMGWVGKEMGNSQAMVAVAVQEMVEEVMVAWVVVRQVMQVGKERVG